MKKFTNILAIILIALLIIFVVMNIETIAIKIFFWRIEGSLSIILFVILILGIITGYLLSLPSSFKKRKQIKELQSKIKKLSEKEI